MPFRHLSWLSKVPLRPLRFVYQPDFLCLNYHLVSEKPVPHVTNIYDFKTPDLLRQDIRFLRKSGFKFADPTVFAKEREPSPRKRGEVLLTFDDGMAQCFHVVRDILKEEGVSAIFFITSGIVDNVQLLAQHRASLAIAHMVGSGNQTQLTEEARAFLELENTTDDKLFDAVRSFEKESAVVKLLEHWNISEADYLANEKPYVTQDQIKSLADDGFVMGGHGIDHRRLDSEQSLEEVERQMSEPCKFVRSLTSQDVVPFAFPYSCRIENNDLKSILHRNKHIGCLFGTGGIRPVSPFLKNRINCDWRYGSSPSRSNLPILLKQAYYSHFRAEVKMRTA